MGLPVGADSRGIPLREVGRHPLLTRARTEALWRVMRAAPIRCVDGSFPPGSRAARAREHLILANLRLAAGLALRAPDRVLSPADRYAYAVKGLIRAVAKFRPSRGRFSTCATPWIRQEIDRAETSQRGPFRVAYGTCDALRYGVPSGKNPRAETLEAGRLALAQHRCAMGGGAASRLGGDDSPYGWSPDRLGNFPDPSPHFSRAVEARDQCEMLLARVTAHQARVLRSRYGLDSGRPKLAREVAEEMGISQQSVAQAERLAIKKLVNVFGEGRRCDPVSAR